MLVTYIWIILGYKRVKKIFENQDKNKMMQEKYAAFKRRDLETVMSWKNFVFVIIMSPLNIARPFTGYVTWFFLMLVGWALSCFSSDYTMVRGKIYHVLRFMQIITARVNIAMSGCWPGMLN